MVASAQLARACRRRAAWELLSGGASAQLASGGGGPGGRWRGGGPGGRWRGGGRREMVARARVLGLALAVTGGGRASGLVGTDRCGGLPQPSVYINYPSLAFVPHGLPAQCAQWEGRKACCTPAAAQAALDAQIALMLGGEGVEDAGSGRGHCFMRSSDAEHGACVSQLEWVACARQCDPRMPRNVSDGQPLPLCYETFTPRVGVDRVLYGSLDTACERAKQITDLGDCGAVLVVGRLDAAIAAGSGEAICSASGRLGAASAAAFAVPLLLLRLLPPSGR